MYVKSATCGLLVIGVSALGVQAGVTLVAYPESVYRFDPVPIVFKVTNHLNETIVNDGDTEHFWYLEVGRSLETMTKVGGLALRSGAWVKPSILSGGAWYSKRHPEWVMLEPGEYLVRAVALLRPTCGQHATGSNHKKTSRIGCAPYRVTSPVVSITVIEPRDAPFDLEAMEYIASDDFPVRVGQPGNLSPRAIMTRLRGGASRLRDRHPNSHYTVSALLGSPGLNSLEMAQAIASTHPDHPLAGYALVRWAESMIRLRRFNTVAVEGANSISSASIEQLDIGDGYKGVLQQLLFAVDRSVAEAAASQKQGRQR